MHVEYMCNYFVLGVLYRCCCFALDVTKVVVVVVCYCFFVVISLWGVFFSFF